MRLYKMQYEWSIDRERYDMWNKMSSCIKEEWLD